MSEELQSREQPAAPETERVIVLAWWDIDGLNIRPATLAQALRFKDQTMATEVFDWQIIQPGTGVEIPYRTLVYFLETNYMRRAPGIERGVAAATLKAVLQTVGNFIEDQHVLSERKRSGLLIIWNSAGALSAFPYKAHRRFRDCSAREVNEALHALGYDFDFRTMAWKARAS